MKTLKLIADWRYGNKPENTRSFEEIPPDEREYASFWYLHGDLEDLVGYDKATVTNLMEGKFGKLSKENVYMMCVDGIISVEVEGISEPCIGYFWTIKYRDDQWKQRGFVCLMSDIKGRRYAESKYNEKARIL